MTELTISVFGMIHFGHDLNGGTHFPLFQRTLVARSPELDINYTSAEISPLEQVSELAKDLDIAACLLSSDARARPVLNAAMETVQTNGQLELEKVFEALSEDVANLAKFLSAIGHSVRQSDRISFNVINSDADYAPIKNKSDVEVICRNLFTDQAVREWLADEVVRRGSAG